MGPSVRGAHGQGEPYVALTSDNDLHGSSYSVALLEWGARRSRGMAVPS